jgi:diguanylate cyclase (GGDEF)-like protein
VNFEEYDDEMMIRLDSRPAFIDSQATRKEVVSKCPSSGADSDAHVYPVFGNRDTIVGFFEVISECFDEASHKLIIGFLEIYHNYLSIIEDSQRDTLTGLLNRKTFDNNIARIIETQQQADKAKQSGKNSPRRRKGSENGSYWLAVMDVDFFKCINDRFGHLYGDEVLLLLAQIMEKTFRQHDRLFRFGGEEFVVVLAPARPVDAKNAFERFRRNIESYDFPQVGKVTISIGFVRIAHNEIPSTFIGHADEALYYAKHNGRNQVCSYEQLVREGKLDTVNRKSDIELF